MAESTTTQLNAESHLLLDQPLLRLPHELSRKNFKAAQTAVERTRENILSSLKSSAAAALSSPSPSSDDALASLDNMLTRMHTLKRKLSSLSADDDLLHRQTRARLAHLQALYSIPSLADVKYDEWSRLRLDRLLVDYLLRAGYGESAAALAREKGIEELVDVGAFVACGRIERSLREGRTAEALAWCAENKIGLRKIGSNLEFELRLQQYIEMVRTCDTQKLTEATMHARKYLASHSDTSFVTRAAGLLAFPPDTPAEPYRSLYSPARYTHLATLFLRTHHTLFSLPPHPLLQYALSAGLSALKTPSCHSATPSSTSSAANATTSLCPICSTELNELARSVPYAHHTKSHIEDDPVVLPNGRIYGRQRLMTAQERGQGREGWVRDLVEREAVYREDEVRKVFIL